MRLYKWILVVVLCTLALWLSKPLFVTKHIIVSMDIDARKAFTAQVFYTEKDGEKFNERQSVKREIHAGISHLDIKLPIKHLQRLRFDFGVQPAKVVIQNFVLVENEIRKLDLNEFQRNQIEQYDVSENKLTIISTQKDPYIVYKPVLDITRHPSVDWYLFLILLCIYWFLLTKGFNYLSKFKLLERHSRIDIIFLAVFFGLLFIPMLHISSAKESVQEKRSLAPKPHLIYQGKIDNNFGKKVNDWFNDHFFGRNALLFLYNHVKYIIAPNSGNENVIVGKNGWLFYTHNNLLVLFANALKLSMDDLDTGLQYVKDADSWCKKNKKKFIYVIAPNKNQIYGENHRHINKVETDEKSVGHQFFNYIKQNSDVDVVYFYKILMENKDKGLLYYKQDTHWSPLGAYFGYQELIQHLKMEPMKHELSEFSEGIDLYKMYPVFPKDTTKYYRIKLHTRDYCKNEQRYVHCINKNSTTNKKLFLFHDSFSNDLYPYLIPHFREIRLIKKRLIEKHDLQYIKEHNFDVVMLESVERLVPEMMRYKFPKE